jgi:predicted CXXCH cytochrome family protein
LTETTTVTDTVVIDRGVANPPPDGAFLGYFEESVRLTTCGNCHIDPQREWIGTAHADAFNTLENSGHAQATCYGCHTVSENGNAESNPAGWNVVQDDVYRDVQCENCHGPGDSHVGPPAGSPPLPSLQILDTNGDPTLGCAECHSGVHHPFAEDWINSKHAEVVTSAAGNPSCQGCHRGQGILEAWGVKSNYIEKNAPEHLAITCGVCHDPHDATYTAQLRKPIETTSVEQHLCASCHNRRTEPTPGSSHGLEPHAPEAALLAGTAGYFFPGGTILPGEIVTTHGPYGNDKLCATCHVEKYDVMDAETGAFQVTVTGHRFIPIPCVDSNGAPTDMDCEVSTAARRFTACVDAGCHSSEAVAFSALTAGTATVNNDATNLKNLIDQVDNDWSSGSGGSVDPSDDSLTVAEGAVFNYELAHFGDPIGVGTPSETNVAGTTVHNRFLITALLISSIDAVKATYGVTSVQTDGVDYRARLEALLEKVPGQ